MFKTEFDKKIMEEAMSSDLFYYKALNLAAQFNARKKNLFSPGRPSFDWRLCEKIYRKKGDRAIDVAEEFNVSVQKVYKVWQGEQPSHTAYIKEFKKSPKENLEHFVEWLKKEL